MYEPTPVAVHHLENKSLPWDYDFRFVIEEISNINDKEQVSEYRLVKIYNKQCLSQ